MNIENVNLEVGPFQVGCDLLLDLHEDIQDRYEALKRNNPQILTYDEMQYNILVLQTSSAFDALDIWRGAFSLLPEVSQFQDHRNVPHRSRKMVIYQRGGSTTT